MPLDAAEARRKLLQLQNKGASNPYMFKPEEGEQTVRIVPNAHLPESALPFEELYWYFNITGKPILSPVSYGEADPIAEFYRDLTKGQKLPREEWEKIKQFKAQMRTYAPIVIRGKESEGIKFWAFGKKVYMTLLEHINEPDYGDISDVTSGHDIKITFTPKEKSDTVPKFPKTDILIRPKATPLHTDAAIVKKLMTGQPKLVDQFDHLSYDALKKILNEYMDDPFTTESSSDEDSVSPTAELVAADEQNISEAVDQEFDKLFPDED